MTIPSNIHVSISITSTFVPSSAALANLMRSCLSLVTIILPSREEKISDPLLNQLIWGLGMPSAVQVRVVALFLITIRSPCIYLTLGGTEWKENLDNYMQFMYNVAYNIWPCTILFPKFYIFSMIFVLK